MKVIMITLLILCSYNGFAQTPYEKSMSDALELWEKGHSTEAAAKLERIAAADKQTWLPAYYQALILITESFRATDISQKALFIQRGNAIISQKSSIGSPSEWLVLKALSITSELTADPMNLGQKLSPKIIASYQQALKADPENPRALHGLAEFQIQTKKFTGGNTDNEYKDLEKALSLYDNDRHKEPFYPSWGKDRVEAMMQKQH
ncbi:hypothetical protein M8998_11720 [Sphingobacterium sp. lm-10]|uniref:hypothetical protein n=1 Tax=Sphingobacterium sp. lm-10 TaxID=2944904 RepID=UPI00201FBE11|nr:hypothetical protein [Sphingobacterium sp. lm-10]MCL7988605.1 hypothetical protein [Sphingobacterium sp. lm-10]